MVEPRVRRLRAGLSVIRMPLLSGMAEEWAVMPSKRA